jgi:hypothetical protein
MKEQIMSEKVIEGILVSAKNLRNGFSDLRIKFSEKAVAAITVSHTAAYCFAPHKSRGISDLEESGNKKPKVRLVAEKGQVSKLRIETDPDFENMICTGKGPSPS